MDKKIIIGLAGPMVAGKGTIAEYLQNNYNASSYGFSRPLRDVLKRLHIEIIRSNMAKLSEILRHNFGQDLISKTIIKDIEEDTNKIIVLDGIRRPSDLEKAKGLSGFVLVKVEAMQSIRYERLLKRSQNADDKSKTLVQFEADEQAEAELQIPLVMAEATYTIDNNGSFEDLYRQIDELVKKLLAQ
ncbi:MAG: AAA family ATPase [Patescibacteria group bacterium]|nr:AAA family ATPase [Patescibacteria group bacterium]